MSNLAFLSKLLEKIVLSQLLSHMNENNLWPVFQSAYRSHHSTETALLRVFNDLLTAADSNQVSVLTLLDLSAAFDTIDHGILLSRLEKVFGIRDSALRFFQSYLEDREQVVSVRGNESNPSPLLYGVPQGSVLGPILFLLYTQPLSDIVQDCRVSHHMFADDTELYGSSPSQNVDTLLSDMQSCTCVVKDWTLHNKLQLNEDKTEVLLVSTKCPDLPTSMRVGQTDIPFARSARNLGVIFDNELSMEEQVNKVCQCAYFELRKISSIRKYLTTDATKTLVTSLVLSRLDFCNSLLAGLAQKHLCKLQRVMNCAARLIFKASKRQHVSPLLSDLHWLSIENRIKYKISTVCFNIISGSAPPYLSELVQLYTPSRNLRSSSDSRIFRVPIRHMKTQGQRAFSYYGPVVWNTLPFHIRHAQTLASFKSLLKTYLFSQQ